MKDWPIVILLGAAGSGKGTQAALLQEQYGYEKVEAGGIVRAKAQEESEMGRKLKAISDGGGHTDDQTITGLVAEYIRSVPAEKPIVIDGYPRTQGQADLLRQLLADAGRGQQRVVAVWINVGLKEAQRRLSQRAECQSCRAIYSSRDVKTCMKCGGIVQSRKDDNPEAITKRLAFFVQATMEAIDNTRQMAYWLKSMESKMLALFYSLSDGSWPPQAKA